MSAAVGATRGMVVVGCKGAVLVTAEGLALPVGADFVGSLPSGSADGEFLGPHPAKSTETAASMVAVNARSPGVLDIDSLPVITGQENWPRLATLCRRLSHTDST